LGSQRQTDEQIVRGPEAVGDVDGNKFAVGSTGAEDPLASGPMMNGTSKAFLTETTNSLSCPLSYIDRSAYQSID
jgi:hypothetical protein